MGGGHQCPGYLHFHKQPIYSDTKRLGIRFSRAATIRNEPGVFSVSVEPVVSYVHIHFYRHVQR